MSWILMATVAVACSVFILTLVNVYLYCSYRERFMKLWVISWVLLELRYLFNIASVVLPDVGIFHLANYLMFIASAVFLIKGTRAFIGKPPERWSGMIAAVTALCTVIVIFLGMPVMMAVIPLFAFMALAYIYIGIQFLKQARHYGIGSRIVGGLFIVWGIHQADYPLLRPIEWIAPWGFLFGSVLTTSIAIGLIIIYFEKTQRILKEKDTRHSNLIESTSNWIWEIDADTVYTYASPQVKALLGYKAEEVLGKTPFDLMPPEKALRIKDYWAGISARRERIHGLECPYRHKDGRLMVLETNGVPYYNADGDFAGYRGMAQDITERKRTEEQIRTLNSELEQRVRERTEELEQSLREMETFCYTVSHDLRTPLRGIHGFSSILQQDYAERLDQEGKEYLQRIGGAANRMGELIDDLLGLSRVNRDELRRVPVDLTTLAGEIADDLTRSQPERNVEFVIAPGLRATGDPSLLGAVLANIIHNAWKFSSRNPAARIEVGSRTDGEEQVFYVRDNGVGFDMQYADKLFLPFHRLHAAEGFEGTGIGLATVQRIIERHGGRVWAESEPGEGTTFFFTVHDEKNT
ncbi:sensor histidine kinase [Geobacter grbiciae]|uniref:sensor histidine kinase n=1 Tax=Geobacter grbiciae TaxID=155042 RepID=UPI001C02DC57|nr:PAS domain-containing sensor histidine kinase [Geobacter grbiciae]MBT1076963.1 PAS domain S-box protein [Geobacter grbiciae]